MPRNFTIRYNPQVYLDIQKAVDFYNKQTQNDKVGRRRVSNTKAGLNNLKQSALHYQVRYDNIRLLPIPSFPYRAHYRIDESSNTIFVEAIFHSSEDPKKWTNR